MLVTKLRVDGQVYYLPESTDIAGLKERIVASVQGGAAFVDFDTHGHGQVSVLMTPQIPVRFEVVERTPEEVEEWSETAPSTDLDPDFLSFGF